MNNTPTSFNADAYARIVKDCSTRRKMIATAEEIVRQAWDTSISVDDALSASLKAVRVVADQPNPDEEIPDALEVASHWIEFIDQKKHSIPTGIAKLDEKLGGLELKTQLILAAKTGKGKSALAFQVARNLAAAKVKVIYFSLEMAKEALWARAACGSVGVMYRDILSGKATSEQKELAVKSSTELAHLFQDFLLIDDHPRTSEQIGRICARERPLVAIVDHLRFVKDRGDNENKRLGWITQAFHEQAKELEMNYITCCQLNRYGDHRDESPEPQLSDLRDSGEIEENADTVLMLHWPKKDAYVEGLNKIPTDIWIRKFRNGPHDIKISQEFDVLHQWFDDVGMVSGPDYSWQQRDN
jgi:replicative DNA helicase